MLEAARTDERGIVAHLEARLAVELEVEGNNDATVEALVNVLSSSRGRLKGVLRG